MTPKCAIIICYLTKYVFQMVHRNSFIIVDNNTPMTELVLVYHTLPIPIPPKNAGIGPIPIPMPVLGAALKNM